jgi:hypothetical protein
MNKNSEAAHPEVLANDLVQKPIPRRGQQLEPVREIIFWEENNPTSIINLVSERLRELMRALPPSLLAMTDNEIREKLDPSWIQDQMRLAFWDEYFLTIDNNQRKMRVQAIYCQSASRETFYNQIENPLFLAYLTKPPAGYILKMRSLLDMAMERMREVLKYPLEDTNGKLNVKLVTEIIKIATLADNRIKGAVTQKIEIDSTQKNLNINLNQNYEAPKTHQDLDKELKMLEKEILSLKPTVPQINYFESEPDDRDVIEATTTAFKAQGA